MKVTKILVALSLFAGSTAFAVQNPTSNSTCPHSKKNDSWTNSGSRDAVKLVFGANSAPKKTAPQVTPNTSR